MTQTAQMELVSPLLARLHECMHQVAQLEQEQRQLHAVAHAEDQAAPEIYFSGRLEQLRDKIESRELEISRLNHYRELAKSVRAYMIPPPLIALNVARHQWHCFRRLDVAQLVASAEAHETLGQRPSTRVPTELFELLRAKVRNSIQKAPLDAVRPAIALGWIRVGWSLRKIGDLQTLGACVCGVQDSGAPEDRACWNAVPRKHQLRFRYLERVCQDSDSNYSAYRSELVATHIGPTIPNLYIAFHDLTIACASPPPTTGVWSSLRRGGRSRIVQMSDNLHQLQGQKGAVVQALRSLVPMREWRRKHSWHQDAKALGLHKMDDDDLDRLVGHWMALHLVSDAPSCALETSLGKLQLQTRPTVQLVQVRSPHCAHVPGGFVVTPSSATSGAVPPLPPRPVAAPAATVSQEGAPQPAPRHVSFKTIAMVARQLAHMAHPDPSDLRSVHDRYTDEPEMVPGCFPVMTSDSTLRGPPPEQARPIPVFGVEPPRAPSPPPPVLVPCDSVGLDGMPLPLRNSSLTSDSTPSLVSDSSSPVMLSSSRSSSDGSGRTAARMSASTPLDDPGLRVPRRLACSMIQQPVGRSAVPASLSVSTISSSASSSSSLATLVPQPPQSATVSPVPPPRQRSRARSTSASTPEPVYSPAPGVKAYPAPIPRRHRFQCKAG